MAKRTSPRIIAGKLKGLRLKSTPGNITRPITDRVKENLFNIIGNDIIGSTFLDAFAGTGSVGIEAYSRGAKFTQFIEKNYTPFTILTKNLLLIEDKSFFSLQKSDALIYLKNKKDIKFDYIYIAPPQYHGIWQKALLVIDSNYELLSEDGWVIVQINPIEYKQTKFVHLTEFDKRKYGNTLLIFLRETI